MFVLKCFKIYIFYEGFFMNVKNIILSICMFGAVFGSSIAVAGVPTDMLDGLDKVAAASAGGLLGVGVGGALGFVKGGAVVGGLFGGPLGAAVGAAIGGATGIVIGWSGLVVVKAFHNELKRR